MRVKKTILSETALIQAIRERHPIGARALYDMYSNSLYGVISRLIPDSQLSEDVLQEAIVKIWCCFAQYDPSKGRLFTWMINLTRNMAVDKLRSKAYREMSANKDLDGLDELPNSSVNVENRADSKLILNGLSILRPQDLEVVNLIYFKGYTQKEVADTLRLPLGTVKTRLMIALRDLRAYFAHDYLLIAS